MGQDNENQQYEGQHNYIKLQCSVVSVIETFYSK